MKRESSSIRNINWYYCFKKIEERNTQDPPRALKFHCILHFIITIVLIQLYKPRTTFYFLFHVSAI